MLVANKIPRSLMSIVRDESFNAGNVPLGNAVDMTAYAVVLITSSFNW